MGLRTGRVIAFLLLFLPAALAQASPAVMWIGNEKPNEKDYYVAFRGQWELKADSEVELRLLGASWFVVWVDGKYLAEGPARFPAAFPEYQTHRLPLTAGRHALAIQVHHIGVSTRILENLAPFLFCEARVEGQPIDVKWKCCRIGGYSPGTKRINPQLGFVEWCDTRKVPDWQNPAYDDAPWAEPVLVSRNLGQMKPLSAEAPRSIVHGIKAGASGSLVEAFGYELDNPAARFFLRDLAPESQPPQGVWRRYDLGRVRLMRPRVTLDLPAGAVVEFAYSEVLSSGRVQPWITLSAGDSCNLDHYVARGGLQEFFPLTPKGGRFLEVHVIAPPKQVRFVKEEVVERCYYGEPQGAFETSNRLLNRIWSVGVETHRACAEDALIDNPTRERGQWAGDVVTVGMDIAACAFSDLRLCRRGLVQCAQCARGDGLISGLCPGGGAYLSTYAAQWVTACIRYWELSGDRALLEEMWPYAEKNIEAFERQKAAEGLKDALGWGFVDWGYVRNPGPSDMGLNLHYLAALRDMKRWAETLHKGDRAVYYGSLAAEMERIVGDYFETEFARGGEAWKRVGYHRAVLGMRLGFFKGARERECVEFIKAHMLSCFPNDPSAPRLSDPQANNPRLITPYFGHYALPLLIERGEMDFVLRQYETCWGWALQDGRTTWLEAFDTRWSHCHQWAGCPTWQLSRYVLGLHPRNDLGDRHYLISLKTGALKKARGAVPLPEGGAIKVEWSKTRAGLRYHLETPVPITIRLPDEGSRTARSVRVEHQFNEVFPLR